MKRKIAFLFICFLLLTGCGKGETLSDNVILAKVFLEEKGYQILSHEQDSSDKFSRSDLREIFGEQVWSVQSIDPENYLDEQIDTVTFIVKDHPLDHQHNAGKTMVTVWIVEDEVIGGWSFPIAKEPLAGAPYSLDGKTAEEMHGNYQEWLEEFRNKYKNSN